MLRIYLDYNPDSRHLNKADYNTTKHLHPSDHLYVFDYNSFCPGIEVIRKRRQKVVILERSLVLLTNAKNRI